MDFFNKISEDEFLLAFQDELDKLHSQAEDLNKSRKSKAFELLRRAADIFNDVGLKKEAEAVALVYNIKDDPATKDLTSEEMVKYLKERGWPFRADSDDEEIEVEVEDACDREK